jgi:hypothetical protein
VKTKLFGLSVGLAVLALMPGAQAQQVSSGAILATIGAPKRVILSALPQVTPQEAAAMVTAVPAPPNGASAPQYLAMKLAAAAKPTAPAAGASKANGPAPTAAEPSSLGGQETPTIGEKFGGLGSWCGGAAPPNPALAVGPTFVLQVINPCLAVYDKAGNLQPGFPISLKSIPLFGPNAKVFGPRALYDWANNRYIVAGGHIDRLTQESFIDLGVSWSSDPRDGWFFYSFNASRLGIVEFQLIDPPALGQDRRAIYVSFNDSLDNGDSYSFSHSVVLPRISIFSVNYQFDKMQRKL